MAYSPEPRPKNSLALPCAPYKQLLTGAVSHDKGRVDVLDSPRRREAASVHGRGDSRTTSLRRAPVLLRRPRPTVYSYAARERANALTSSRVPRRNRSTRLDSAVVRNTALTRLHSRRQRRSRPRPPLRPKRTDQDPGAPTTHSRGSTYPMPSRRRLPPRPERSESVSCHHPAYCLSNPTLQFTLGESGRFGASSAAPKPKLFGGTR
jgi:hypothetical protein